MLSCTFSMFWTTVTSQTSSEKRRTNRHTVKPTVMFGSRAGFAKGSHTLPCFHSLKSSLQFDGGLSLPPLRGRGGFGLQYASNDQCKVGVAPLSKLSKICSPHG